MQKAKLPVRQLVILCKFCLIFFFPSRLQISKLTGILAICRFAEPSRFAPPWPMRYGNLDREIYQMEIYLFTGPISNS